MTERPLLRCYGRRRGKPLSPLKKNQKATELPKFTAGKKDFEKADILEIGFGGGEHLLFRARENPAKNFIGAEVFENGVIRLLQDILKYDIGNIRIYPDDVRGIFKEFKDGQLETVYLLFPDPWPKKRHEERRFIHPDNLKEIKRILKKGGLFVVATDHPVYQAWVKEKLLTLPEYEKVEMSPPDMKTRYQAKAVKEGRTPIYFFLRKR